MNLKRLFSRVILLLALPLYAFGAPKPSADSCNFYLDMEKEFGCWLREDHESNYFVQYGYKYCGLFKGRASVWKDERTIWSKKTSLCLQNAIREPSVPINCPKVESDAFSSHPGCYRSSGFCDLTKWQKTTVVWAAAGIDVLLSPRESSYQALILLKDCLKDFSADIISALRARAKYLIAEHVFSAEQLYNLFVINKMSVDDLDRYGRFALNKLLGVDKGTPAASMKAFIDLYSSDRTTTLPYNQIENDCVHGRDLNSRTCETANAVLGSSKEIANLKGIPRTINASVLEEIVTYRDKLQSGKRTEAK